MGSRYTKSAFNNLRFATLSKIRKKTRSKDDDESNTEQDVLILEVDDNNSQISEEKRGDKTLRHTPNIEITDNQTNDVLDETRISQNDKGRKSTIKNNSDDDIATGKKHGKKRRRKHKKKHDDNNLVVTSAAAASVNDTTSTVLDEEEEALKRQHRREDSEMSEIGSNDMHDSDAHKSSPKHKKKEKKKKKKTSSVQESTVNIEAVSSKKKIKKKKKKKAAKKKKDNIFNEKIDDEKDRTIQNLTKELEKKDIMIGSLNETLEFLHEKVQFMERKLHNSLHSIDSLEGENVRDNELFRNSVDRNEIEDKASNTLESLPQKNSDTDVQVETPEDNFHKLEEQSLISESETSEYLEQESEENSINIQDVFHLPLSEQSSSEESLSQTDLTQAAQVSRNHRSFSQFEFPKTKKQSLDLMFEKFSKSVPEHLFSAEYVFDLSLDRDDVFDLAPTSSFRKDRLFKSFPQIQPSKDDSFTDEFSKSVPGYLFDIHQPSLARSFDDRSLDDPSSYAQKPLLTAAFKVKALKSKSESDLKLDSFSLNEDRILDPPSSISRPKKPLLGATFKAKVFRSKSESDLNFDNYSLNESEIFDPPTSISRPKKPLLEAAFKAKALKSNSESGLKDAQTNFEMHNSLEDDESRDCRSKIAPEHVLSLSQPTLFHPADTHHNGPNQSDSGLHTEIVPEHLMIVDQPAIVHVHDEYFIEPKEIFDSHIEELNRKPLLTAALEAKKKQNQISSKSFSHFETKIVDTELSKMAYNELSKSVPDHLSNLYQPTKLSFRAQDEYPIDPEEMLDTSSTEMPTKKPLLADELKAKVQQEQIFGQSSSNCEAKNVCTELSIVNEEFSKSVPDHLANLHQSTNLSSHAHDELSIDNHALFDPLVINEDMNVKTAIEREISEENMYGLCKENESYTYDEEEKLSINDSNEGTGDGEEDVVENIDNHTYENDNSFKHSCREEEARGHDDDDSCEVTLQEEDVFGMEDDDDSHQHSSNYESQPVYDDDKEDDEDEKLDQDDELVFTY